MLYMGSDGFYWVTAYHPETHAVIEVRKGDGSQAWRSAPGERHISYTGEYGTLWRHRGRAPQRICGVGWVAEGFDVSSYFRRRPDSYDPRVAWMFAGIEDEILGDFGLVGFLTAWQTYAFGAVGVGAVFLLSNAMQAGPLVASQPALTLGDATVSMILGVIVYEEHIRTGWWLLPELAGIALIVAGVFALARIPPAEDAPPAAAEA
jgi:multidrug transporter EmrE-like cation transporter